jgi:hypothetical protein
MVAPGFATFVLELLGDPAFRESATDINRCLSATDLEGDGNAHAIALMSALEWIAKQPKPLAERVEKMLELVSMRGKVRINMAEWTGW